MTDALKLIFKHADQIRVDYPERYGVKGAKPNTPGYVKGGWKAAVDAATEDYYRAKGTGPSEATRRARERGSIAHRLKNDPEEDALYRGYHQQLEDLKTRYYEAGLDIKAAKPAKRERTRERKRLSPVIL